MSCGCQSARPNPPADDFAADLDAIGAAYERLGHWWLVAGVTKAAGFPAGAELDARIRGLVGEPLTFETGAPALGKAAEEAVTVWARMRAGAAKTLEIANRNKFLLAAAVGGALAWRALDLDHAADLEAIEADGQRLEQLFNQLPDADRAKVLSSWGAAHFGRSTSSGIPTWALVGGGLLAAFLVYKAVR